MFTSIDIIQPVSADITIRPLSLKRDLQVATEILNKQYIQLGISIGLRCRDVKAIYTAIRRSPSSSAWIALSSDLPLFILEVHQAQYYDTPAGLRIVETDYVTDLFIQYQPLLPVSVYANGLRSCITHVLQMQGIRSLYAPVHSGLYHSFVRKTFQLAGFTRAEEATRQTGREILQYLQ
jgi:hypothetical protein